MVAAYVGLLASMLPIAQHHFLPEATWVNGCVTYRPVSPNDELEYNNMLFPLLIFLLVKIYCRFQDGELITPIACELALFSVFITERLATDTLLYFTLWILAGGINMLPKHKHNESLARLALRMVIKKTVFENLLRCPYSIRPAQHLFMSIEIRLSPSYYLAGLFVDLTGYNMPLTESVVGGCLDAILMTYLVPHIITATRCFTDYCQHLSSCLEKDILKCSKYIRTFLPRSLQTYNLHEQVLLPYETSTCTHDYSKIEDTRLPSHACLVCYSKFPNVMNIAKTASTCGHFTMCESCCGIYGGRFPNDTEFNCFFCRAPTKSLRIYKHYTNTPASQNEQT